MLIKTDGLLSALAFAVEPKRNDRGEGGHKHSAEFAIAGAIAAHLRHHQPDGIVAITTASNAHGLVDELARGDATRRRRATAEALAFLNYLKRFVA